MRYLITGGCGFLDTRSPDEVIAALAKAQPDIIFHFAGQVAMTTSLTHPRLDFETNAYGTFNVLEAIRTAMPTAGLIYSSTNKVYGDLESLRYEEQNTRYIVPDYPNGFNEMLPLQFSSPYGCSKGAADQYILDYVRMYGIRAAVFRHSSMYGSRQFATFDQGWVGWFCRQVMDQASGKNDSFTVAGNGKQVRDLLYADDIIALYLQAAQQLSEITGRVFNIGGGMENSLSILELLSHLGEKLSVEPRVQHLVPRASDQKIFVADNTAVTTAIGWQPKVSWQQGVANMCEWVSKMGGEGG